MHIFNTMTKESYKTLRASYPNLHIKKDVIRGMDVREVTYYIPEFMHSQLGSLPLLKDGFGELMDVSFNNANIDDIIGIFVHNVTEVSNGIKFTTSVYTIDDETDVEGIIQGFMKSNEDYLFVVFVKKLDVELRTKIHDEVARIAEGVSPRHVSFKPKPFKIRCWVSVRESVRSKDEILSKISKMARVGIHLTNDRSMQSNNYVMTLVDINDLNRLKLSLPEVVNGIHKIHYGMMLFDKSEETV